MSKATDEVLNLHQQSLREINSRLRKATAGHFVVTDPHGAHAVAVGITGDITVEIMGSVGYYAAGMHQRGTVTVHGNAGTGIGENIMSGTVRVIGSATMSAGATGCGGLLVIEGNAGARCGISMKGVDVVVGGNIGHMGAFMAQAGTLVVLGDADHHLGDSIYEANVFVRGSVASLGADCVEAEMRPGDLEHLEMLLSRAGLQAEVGDFRRYGSARRLYNFSVDDIDAELRDAGLRDAELRRGSGCGIIDGTKQGSGDDPGADDPEPAHDRKNLSSKYLGIGDDWHHRESHTFDRNVISEIQRAANTGIYRIRGFGAKRRLPTLDDLVFLGASMSRYPLEGYREDCGTDVTIGEGKAERPVYLRIPITIAGMSFGSLSAQAKEALGRGANAAGTSTTTGDGGMTPEERKHSSILVYQYLPSRYGMNPDDIRKADAIEVVVGQGAKPGGGGMLLGQKVSERVAAMRTLPEGVDQRSACRHPDWTGPDDLQIKILELREIVDWQVPIYIKVGAARPYYDTALAVKAGADAIVVDGMQGGTAATQEVFIEHVGVPTIAAIGESVRALKELGVHREVKLIAAGGIRSGADVAKALALGADAVSIGTAALIAIGDNSPHFAEQYRVIGSAAGYWEDYQAGTDPAGITTQDPELSRHLDPVIGGRRLANYLQVLTLELQTLARANGKSHVHNLEPEDLAALTVEAAAMAKVPIAGTSWIPGVIS